MLPGYRYMDSYPQPHHHFGYFPTSWNEGRPCSDYSTPMEYHGFYPYCPPPAAYYPTRPPPPPPPFSYHGPYPPYYGGGGGFYPPTYHAPRCFPVDQHQPRYEYDKERHCCGCPNHVCKHLEDKGHPNDSSPTSLAEIGNKYPYPFVWFPPEHSSKSKANDNISESEPKNGKPVKSLHEDDKIQDDENKRSQFPFPFFWIPGYDKLKTNENKESDTSPKAIQEQPPKLKIIPVSPPGNGDHLVEENSKAVKAANEKKTKEIHVKQIEENEKKPADNKADSRSSSPGKSSKLPPVCLRVDPLPRKKNGNGKSTSRSPSPPGEKSRATTTAPSVHPTPEAKSCSGPVEKVSSENKAEKEKPVREIKVNEAKDGLNNSKEEAEETTNKLEEKQLSTTEAAVIIQSFHRGHEVRKWEPLKKLKQIAKVREQVDEVRGRIQTLESSIELHKEGKQRVVIGETIMSLLLQLDTIQGLHPSVRDIRKVVARELVSLQERLDSLVSRNVWEEEHEVANSSEVCVQEALSETVPSDRCEPSEPLEKPKEAGNQFRVKEQHSTEAAIETTNIEPSNGSSDFQVSVNAKVGESSAEEVGSVQKVQEAQDDSVEEPDKSIVEEVDGVIEAPGGGVEEPTEPTFVADEKVESEIEKLVEASKKDRSFEFHGDHNLGVAQGIDSVDIQDTPEPGAEHVVQEVLQEAADIIEPGAEHVVQELPQGVTSISEADAKHSPEVSQGVLDASELGAEDVQESSPQEVSYAFEIDAKHVQESSQQGVSNVSEFDADISDLGSKHFVEVLPQGGLDAPDASEIDPDHTQGLPQRVSDVLESDAVHLPELPHAIPDENQMTGKYEKDEWPQHENSSAQNADRPHCDLKKIEFRSGEGVERLTREEEKEVDVAGAVQEKLSPKYDPSEEARTDKNVTQEVEIKEDEVRTVNNPSKVEAVDKKLVEENEKLREMIGKLLLEGKQQLTAISDLHGRVNDLERKLTKKKKLKMRKQKPKKQGLRSGV